MPDTKSHTDENTSKNSGSPVPDKKDAQIDQNGTTRDDMKESNTKNIKNDVKVSQHVEKDPDHDEKQKRRESSHHHDRSSRERSRHAHSSQSRHRHSSHSRHRHSRSRSPRSSSHVHRSSSRSYRERSSRDRSSRDRYRDRSSRDRSSRDRYRERSSRDRSSRDRYRDRSSRDRSSHRREERTRYDRERENSRRDRSRSKSRSPSSDREAARPKVKNSVVELLKKLGGGVATAAAQNLSSTGAMYPGMGSSFGTIPPDRVLRELYVGNLPYGIQPQQVSDFFKAALKEMNAAKTEPSPVIAVRPASPQERFAFVEFATADEASSAMMLNGINMMNFALKIGRPKNFTQVAASMGVTPSMPTQMSNAGLTNLSSTLATNPSFMDATTGAPPAKILIVSNYSEGWGPQQVKEIMEPFGAIKRCEHVGDDTSQVEIEYEDPLRADSAVQGLNGLDLGDRKLSVALKPSDTMEDGETNEPQPTHYLKLTNILIVEHLSDPEEYTDILEDVQEEAESFGKIIRVIPQTRPGSNPPADAQDSSSSIPVYIQFDDPSATEKCLEAMKGRKFDGRDVGAFFVEESQVPSTQQPESETSKETTESITTETNMQQNANGATMEQTVDHTVSVELD